MELGLFIKSNKDSNMIQDLRKESFDLGTVILLFDDADDSFI